MTNYAYEIIDNGINGNTVLRSDGAVIPTDPTNSDYQRYLRWLENPNAEELTIFPVTPPNYEQTQEGAE